MSSAATKRNLETIEDAYAAFNAGDVGRVMAAMDPNIEWTMPEGSPFAGTHSSPEAVGENLFARLATDIEGFRAVPDRFVDGGDTIVVLGTATGTVRATNEAVDIPFAHVYDMADGRITRFVDYTDTHRWQQAMGG